MYKSIIFPACSILKRQCCPHQKFYYIQENLNAFNSLLTAERLWMLEHDSGVDNAAGVPYLLQWEGRTAGSDRIEPVGHV